MALKRSLIRRIVGGTKRILKKFGSKQVAKAREIEAATIAPVRRFKNDVTDATSMPGLQQRPQGPSRVLALIEHDDDDAVAHETVAEAWLLAREFDANLALGQLVNWKLGSGSVFPGGFLSDELETALCEPAMRHLENIADDIGIEHPAVMATALLDRKEAANKLIGEWRPDLIIVHKRSNFDFARQRSANFDTPSGRISSRIQCAGTKPNLKVEKD